MLLAVAIAAIRARELLENHTGISFASGVMITNIKNPMLGDLAKQGLNGGTTICPLGQDSNQLSPRITGSCW